MMVHFSCQRVAIATSQINDLLNALINAHLKFKEKNIYTYMLVWKLVVWGRKTTSPLWKSYREWSIFLVQGYQGSQEMSPNEQGGWRSSCHPPAHHGILGDGHTWIDSSSLSREVWLAMGSFMCSPPCAAVSGGALFGCVTLCSSRLTWFCFYPSGVVEECVSILNFFLKKWAFFVCYY